MAASLSSYCADLVRTQHRDFYLCTLFAAAQRREAWLALAAFHYEIGRISAVIGEEMVGFVRYAWWRETLAKCCAGSSVGGNPVAEALSVAIDRYALPRSSLERIIDAHEQAMADQKGVDETFCAATLGELFRLCAYVAGDATGHGVSALGIAWGVMEAARLPAMDAGHRQHYLDVLAEQLPEVGGVTSALQPFRRAVEFYARRMKKQCYGISGMGLPLYLWWKCQNTA